MIDLLIYTVLSLALGVGVLSMLVAKGRHGQVFRWLGVYLLLSFAFQVVGEWMMEVYKNNMLPYNLSIPVYFVALFMLFRVLETGKAYRRAIGRVFIVWSVPMLLVLLAALVEGNFAMRGLSKGIVVINLTVVTACLIFFYHMLQNLEATPPMQQAHFLVAIGLFFYFLCSFVCWAAYGLFSAKSRPLADLIGNVNLVLVLLFYLLMLWAVAVQWKTLRRSGK